MRVLVIGASGFIGRYLVRRLSEATGDEVSGTFRSGVPEIEGVFWHGVELTDAEALEGIFRSVRPEVVVHLAAMADVGAAERDPATAAEVNVAGTSKVARMCRLQGARLVFVSTEYVFDGVRGYYREDDAPNPTTVYGRTKWEAEREVARLAPQWSVVRTSIVYGWPGEGKRNFAPWLIERLRSGNSYQGPTEVFRTPVYVEHLVDGIAGLAERDQPGIHHVAARDWVSMYDFAAAVAEGFDLDRELVVPAGPVPGGARGAEPRDGARSSESPDMLGLDCARTMRLLGLAQPGLEEGIAAMRASAPPA